MEKKLIPNLPQTADRKYAFQLGVENELRRRLQLMCGDGSSNGIYGAVDVDNDSSPCSLSVNPTELTAVDVAAGTVVFNNGEYVDITDDDLQGIALVSTEDANVLRLEYSETATGPVTASKFYDNATNPSLDKSTPLVMLVVETATAYNAQPATTKANSVVLGVARIDTSGSLSVDNGRDTYSYNRPWFSVRALSHETKVGTGLATDNNPHALSGNDLTVGDFTMYQALAGPYPAVMAFPNGVAKIPGERCTETIPAGNFATDPGAVTGKPGALYAFIGKWPERLVQAVINGTTTRLAAWIVPGTNILAIHDPTDFAVAVDVDITFTSVQAGSLPNSVVGLTELNMQQPKDGEIISSGGNFIETMSNNKVLFSDVGLVPMPFDILVDSTGEAYKTPQVVYCNTLLDTISTQTTFEVQPLAETYIRVAISNFNPGFTEVRLRVVGIDSDGNSVSETFTFTGPLPVVVVSGTENTAIRQISTSKFKTLTSLQIENRNNDGPNTTVTVFAELDHTAEAEIRDHCPLATVHWTGGTIGSDYTVNATSAIDLRQVTPGGPPSRMAGIAAAQDYALGTPSEVFALTRAGNMAVLVEDFDEPAFWDPITSESSTSQMDQRQRGFRGDSYQTRRIPVPLEIVGALTKAGMRLIPRTHRHGAALHRQRKEVTVELTVHTTTGTFTDTGAFPTQLMSAPYDVFFNGLGGVTGDIYAVELTINTPGRNDLSFWQGFMFYLDVN